MQIIKTLSNDPYVNLAFEEYLIEQKQDVIYFWTNAPTIVIGRNQNPYKECNLEKIREDKVNLVRRRSGGGAVYHDYGNVNFTIISKKEEGVIEKNFNLVIAALKEYNIDCYINGRNDLEVNGKKISGSAFYEEDDIYCHHGTLLVNSNLSKLSNYLTANKLKLESKGITSVRSRVSNLIEFNKDITIDKFIDSVCKILNLNLKLVNIEDVLKLVGLKEKVDRYHSWQWVYGESMEYNIKFEQRFDFGIIEITFMVNDGKIIDANIFTDSVIIDNFDLLKVAYINQKFKKDVLVNITNSIIKNNTIKENINSLFKEL